MNSQFHHDLFSYGYFPDPYFPPFMNHMYFTPWNQNLFTTSVKLNQESDLPNQIVKSEIQAPAFQAKAVPNVIIKKKEKLVACRSSKDREFNSPSAKSSIKSIKFQKENRNVVSNLLRVFLKNILEVHSYDNCINLVINRNNLKITGTQFFSWLVSFKINFKNYIKPKQIMRIINDKHSEEHQLIFRVLMRQFVDSLGVSHCLTSKRLDSICSRRHIEGLRELLTLREEQSQ